jgi:hypothetical protein
VEVASWPGDPLMTEKHVVLNTPSTSRTSHVDPSEASDVA